MADLGGWVTLNGYRVVRTTEKAIGIRKLGLHTSNDLIWVPRSMVLDGDEFNAGDTDIVVRELIATDKGLDH